MEYTDTENTALETVEKQYEELSARLRAANINYYMVRNSYRDQGIEDVAILQDTTTGIELSKIACEDAIKTYLNLAEGSTQESYQKAIKKTTLMQNVRYREAALRDWSESHERYADEFVKQSIEWTAMLLEDKAKAARNYKVALNGGGSDYIASSRQDYERAKSTISRLQPHIYRCVSSLPYLENFELAERFENGHKRWHTEDITVVEEAEANFYGTIRHGEEPGELLRRGLSIYSSTEKIGSDYLQALKNKSITVERNKDDWDNARKVVAQLPHYAQVSFSCSHLTDFPSLEAFFSKYEDTAVEIDAAEEELFRTYKSKANERTGHN
ncbi:uncharacterized protein L201_004501 [Kwoniella dendrophila CBS 6074]|uniref:Uncharacterized protein n=1 Tax=Kwoniella dendrophila CBS 6074 TaxID=1295534 RepID=A0AAX4JXY6_9TREE